MSIGSELWPVRDESVKGDERRGPLCKELVCSELRGAPSMHDSVRQIRPVAACLSQQHSGRLMGTELRVICDNCCNPRHRCSMQVRTSH